MLKLIELAFPHDALVWLAAILDAVLELAIATGQPANHLVVAGDGVAIWEAPGEADHLAGIIPVCRTRIERLIVHLECVGHGYPLLQARARPVSQASTPG